MDWVLIWLCDATLNNPSMLFFFYIDLHRGVGEPAWRQAGRRHRDGWVVPGRVSQDLPVHAGLHASRLRGKHEDCRKRGPLHGNRGASQWHVNTWKGVGLREQGGEEGGGVTAPFFKHPRWHVAEFPTSCSPPEIGIGTERQRGRLQRGGREGRGGGGRRGGRRRRIKWPFYFFNLADDYSLTET